MLMQRKISQAKAQRIGKGLTRGSNQERDYDHNRGGAGVQAARRRDLRYKELGQAGVIPDAESRKPHIHKPDNIRGIFSEGRQSQ